MTRQPDNTWGDISEAELAARNRAVAQANKKARGLDTVIATRARHLRDDKPPPDRQRGLDATRDARTRLLWAQWHAQQAARHRQTLTDLVAHHEREAERLLE